MFPTASASAPWYYGLLCKHSSGFACLLCSLFHLSVGYNWEGPSPAVLAQCFAELPECTHPDPDQGLPP